MPTIQRRILSRQTPKGVRPRGALVGTRPRKAVASVKKPPKKRNAFLEKCPVLLKLMRKWRPSRRFVEPGITRALLNRVSNQSNKIRQNINGKASSACYGSMSVLLLVFSVAPAQVTIKGGEGGASYRRHCQCPQVCSDCILGNEEFLASDSLQGRGSGTHDELVAATFIAAQLRAYGIAPVGTDGGYFQVVPVLERRITGLPTIDITPPGGPKIVLTYGKDFLVNSLAGSELSGVLQKVYESGSGSAQDTIGPDAIVLEIGGGDIGRKASYAAGSSGAIAWLFTSSRSEIDFTVAGKSLPRLRSRLQGETGAGFNRLELSVDAGNTLGHLPDGSQIQLHTPIEQEHKLTWNAIGVLGGKDPKLKHDVVLLSAHLDHLGIGQPVKGDNIYNGADDDASGVTAILELARVLGAGSPPRRTVVFALFGSEEVGGLGAAYFREHPPVALKQIVANLEFEMIGRSDPKLKYDRLWLTGWERSNLGPSLAAHGAKLVPDPHPEQNFFARSDNYVLAKKGVVAHTISSFGLHKDYHRPSDDLTHLDFKHMDAAIASMLPPLRWLVNSDFTPKWREGEQP